MKFKDVANDSYANLIKRLLKHKDRVKDFHRVVFKISFHRYRQSLLSRLVELLETNTAAGDVEWIDKLEKRKVPKGYIIGGQFRFVIDRPVQVLTVFVEKRP